MSSEVGRIVMKMNEAVYQELGSPSDWTGLNDLLVPLVEAIVELRDAGYSLLDWSKAEYRSNPRIDARMEAALAKIQEVLK